MMPGIVRGARVVPRIIRGTRMVSRIINRTRLRNRSSLGSRCSSGAVGRRREATEAQNLVDIYTFVSIATETELLQSSYRCHYHDGH
jgi:hypothetical protein